MTKYFSILLFVLCQTVLANSETYHDDLKHLTKAIKDLTAAINKNSKTLKKTALYIDDKNNKNNWPE